MPPRAKKIKNARVSSAKAKAAPAAQASDGTRLEAAAAKDGAESESAVAALAAASLSKFSEAKIQLAAKKQLGELSSQPLPKNHPRAIQAAQLLEKLTNAAENADCPLAAIVRKGIALGTKWSDDIELRDGAMRLSQASDDEMERMIANASVSMDRLIGDANTGRDERRSEMQVAAKEAEAGLAAEVSKRNEALADGSAEGAPQPKQQEDLLGAAPAATVDEVGLAQKAVAKAASEPEEQLLAKEAAEKAAKEDLDAEVPAKAALAGMPAAGGAGPPPMRALRCLPEAEVAAPSCQAEEDRLAEEAGSKADEERLAAEIAKEEEECSAAEAAAKAGEERSAAQAIEQAPDGDAESTSKSEATTQPELAQGQTTASYWGCSSGSSSSSGGVTSAPKAAAYAEAAEEEYLAQQRRSARDGSGCDDGDSKKQESAEHASTPSAVPRCLEQPAVAQGQAEAEVASQTEREHEAANWRTELLAELAQAEEENRALVRSHLSERDELSRLSEAMENLSMSQEFEAELRQREHEVTALRAEMAQAEDENTALVKQMKSHEFEIISVKKQSSASKNLCQKLKVSVDKLEDQVVVQMTTQMSTTEEMEMQRLTMGRAMVRLQEEVVDARQRHEHDSEIAKQRELQLEQREHQLGFMQDEKIAAEAKLADAASELMSRNLRIANISREMTASAERANAAEASLTNSRQEAEDLREALSDESQTVNHLKTLLGQAEARHRRAEADLRRRKDPFRACAAAPCVGRFFGEVAEDT